MQLQQLITLFRQEAFDTAQPYLWSDAELTSYANEAQEMYCRQTAAIRDASSSAAQLAVTANSQWAPLDDRVLKIRWARSALTNKLLLVKDVADLPETDRPPVVYAPRFIYMGVEDGKVMFDSIPAVNDTIMLMVERMPMFALQFSADELEITPSHQSMLTHWMMFRAFGKPDSDAYNPARSANERQLFFDTCQFARVDQERLIHTNRRVVSYGGL